MQKRLQVMVLLRGMFPNMDACEYFFEEEDWYFRNGDTQGKKIVPLFPYLQKMVIHQHRYIGSIVADDAQAGTDKTYLSQILLDVSGYSEDDVEGELMDGGWLRSPAALTVFPPVSFIKGYDSESFASVPWEIRSGS